MLGAALLWGSVAAGLASSLISSLRFRWRGERAVRLLTAAQATLLTLAFLYLLYKFYLPDFNVNYVFTRVSAETPLAYRLTASWVGQEGVFMLWGWMLSLCTLYFLGRSELPGSEKSWALAILALLTTFFALLAALTSPFKPTMAALEQEAGAQGASVKAVLQGMEAQGLYKEGVGFVQGQGMSPALMSPWMAVHPPIVFSAYALSTIPFALCLLHMLGGRVDWAEGSKQWARLAWMLLSTGLLLGSFWAYEELSFGGYWTWDPIETGSLIPWVTLTVFLHSIYERERKGGFKLIGPIAGAVTTPLILYGTFITKSGLITSTHAYASSNITPVLAALVILTVIGLAALTLLLVRREGIAPDLRPPTGTGTAFYLATLLFAILLLILLYGITHPLISKLMLGKTVSTGKAYYNRRGYPVAVALMLLTGYCLLLWLVKGSSALKASLTATGVSLIALILKPWESDAVNLFAPIAIFAVLAALARSWKEVSRRRHGKLRGLSAQTLHLGIALLLLGVVLSSALQSSVDLVFQYPGGVGAVKDAGEGYSLKLLGLAVYQGMDGSWVQQLNVSVLRHGKSKGDLLLKMRRDRRFGRYPKVSILRGFTADVYAVYYGMAGAHGADVMLPVNVKINPFVSLVWIGSAIAILSSLLILVSERLYSKS